jgi:tape measure domain-containing protein
LAFPKVGVEAVVEGLGTFERDAKAVDEAIARIGKTGQGAVGGLDAAGSALGGLTGFLGGVLQIASGILAAEVFRKIGAEIRDMAKEAFDAAGGFQLMEVRFQTLLAREQLATNQAENFTGALQQQGVLTEAQANRILALRTEYDSLIVRQQKLADEGKLVGSTATWIEERLGFLQERIASSVPDWDRLGVAQQQAALGQLDLATALELSAGPAEQMVNWAKQLSITTPFSAQTIADAVALGNAFGIQSDEAKDLVANTLDFVAGMGLEEEHMRRIILNFGQMISQGKVTGTELRDLARGSLVPVTSVLQRMQENLALSGMSFDAFRKEAAKGTYPVEEFIRAFQQITEEQFAGSAERLVNTLPIATQKLRQFLTEIFGANALGPIVDRLTTGLVNLLDQLLTPEFLNASQQLGDALAMVVDSLGGLFGVFGRDIAFDPLALVQGFTDFVTDVAGGIDNLRKLLTGDIALEEFMGGLFAQPLLPDEWALVNDLIAGIEGFTTFLEDHGPGIQQIFQGIGERVGEFLQAAAERFGPFVTETLQAFGQWAADNGPNIEETFLRIGQAIDGLLDIAEIGLLPAIEGLFVGARELVLGLLTDIFRFTSGEINFLELLAAIPGDILAAFGALMDTIAPSVLEIFGFDTTWEQVKAQWAENARLGLIIVINTLNEAAKSSQMLVELGRIIVNKIWDGLKQTWAKVEAWFRQKWEDSLIREILDLLGISSPSRVFMAIGEDIMAGLQQGIERATPQVTGAMATAAGGLMQGAMAPASMAGAATTNYYDVNVAASYPVHQAPVQVQDDVALILARLGG